MQADLIRIGELEINKFSFQSNRTEELLIMVYKEPGVLEDDKFQDRKLVRKMVKYAKTFEQLHRVYQQQSEALHDMISNLSENEIWFDINRPPIENNPQKSTRKSIAKTHRFYYIRFLFSKPSYIN